MGNEPEHITMWQEMAAQLDTNKQAALKAMMNLGCTYAQGTAGVSQSAGDAIDWWTKAAQHDVPEAFLNIALLVANLCVNTPDFTLRQEYCAYQNGVFDRATLEKVGMRIIPYYLGTMFQNTGDFARQEGLAEPEVQAFFGEAAKFYFFALTLFGEAKTPEDILTTVRAANALARLRLCGDGIEKDEKKAHSLYEIAAAMGFGEAQYSLAVLCYHGIGTERSLEKAAAWLAAAVASIPENYPSRPDFKERAREELAVVRAELALDAPPLPRRSFDPQKPFIS